MQQRYWSVRDAGWLASPRPVGALETPWSLHARPRPRWTAPCTAVDDLRWLPVRRRRVPGQRRPVPERPPVRT